MTDEVFLPQETFEACEKVFGGAVYNPASRTFKSLERRISHALRVWEQRYGPLNAKQLQYADAVLAAVVLAAARDARKDGASIWAYAQSRIARAIVNERVEAGMKTRRETLDGSHLLVEAFGE